MLPPRTTRVQEPSIKSPLSIRLNNKQWVAGNVECVICCCKASEALGLPLCIICVSIISSVVSILDVQKVQKAACLQSTSFTKALY